MLMTMSMRVHSIHTCISEPRITPGEHARYLTSTAGRSRREDTTRSDSASMSGTEQDGMMSWLAVCSLAAVWCASKVNMKVAVSQR